MDVPCCRSWSISGTSEGGRKISQEVEGAMICSHHLVNRSILGVALLLPVQCTCCHFLIQFNLVQFNLDSAKLQQQLP